MEFIDYVHRLDQDISLAINNLHNMFIDQLMQFMSNKEVWFPLYLLIAVLLFKRLGWRRALIAIVAIALTITACDQFSNLIKDTVARLRPCYSTYMIEGKLNMLESRHDYYGFFSAHAANAFGFAISSFLLFKTDKTRLYYGYGAAIILWATLVGFSRVFVGKHYFGDVVTGMLIGIFFGILTATIAKLIISKYRIA